MKMELIGLWVAVGLCAGCASTVNPSSPKGYAGTRKVDVKPLSPGGCGAPSRALESCYNQPRNADLLSLKGTNMTVTYTGVTEYKVATIMPPLNVIPREPGLLEKIVDGVAGLGKWGLGWYFGAQIADKAFSQPRTVEPTVVQPEIVMVPGPVESDR